MQAYGFCRQYSLRKEGYVLHMVKPNPLLMSCHLLLKDVGFDSAMEAGYLPFPVKLNVCCIGIPRHHF